MRIPRARLLPACPLIAAAVLAVLAGATLSGAAQSKKDEGPPEHEAAIRRAQVWLEPRVPIVGYGLTVLTTVVLYLLACDPLPPCAGTVRKWIQSVAPSRVTAPESNQS